MSDFLNEILEPQKQPPKDGSGHWLVCEPRCKTSLELEQKEADYLGNQYLPIPFFGAEGMEKLSEQDLAQLKAMDVTPDEYKVLVGAMTIEEYEHKMELETS